jgi:Uma2 family endonuclease
MKTLIHPRSVRSVRARRRSLRPRGALWTDQELLRLGASSDTKYELWDGKVIAMPPAGPRHGAVISRLLSAIGVFVYEHKLGEVFDGQTGFRLSVEHCFEPDISFVSVARLKHFALSDDKLIHGSPDLAVEVLSPSDSITKTEKKIDLFLTYGARLAWMIDPRNRTVRVYRPGAEMETLREERLLSGNSVLPGFRFALSRLFEGL